MSKSKRLLELMMIVNRKRKFTVKELANEFDVSSRTILRDLQELSELGVPLYSEVGPHGGYQVLNERILPPIAFSEEEAIAIFFAIHALRHYSFLPFETESSSALSKFYNYMPGDLKDRIDQMKNRVDFVTPKRHTTTPYLSILLEAAINQKVILIDYKYRKGVSRRDIQPIGIYASNGFWYCPAYCFLKNDFRLFRCDKILSAVYSTMSSPLDLQQIHLENRSTLIKVKEDFVDLYVELTKDGVQRCETELWPIPQLYIAEDGTGRLTGNVSKSDIPFYASFLIGLGNEATVKHPAELIDCIKQILSDIRSKYV